MRTHTGGLFTSLPWRRSVTSLATVFAIGTIFAGCDSSHWTFEPSPDEIPLDSIVGVSRTRTGPLPADTNATDTITVVLERDSEPRLVTFTTTFGWFDQTNREKTLAVRASLATPNAQNLTARVVFRTDTLRTGAVVDTATIRATVGNFTNVLRIPLAR
jgi:hypothetical protein